MNEAPIILSLCDVSGVFVDPFSAAGYECWIVDIQHPAGVGPMVNNIRRVGADIRTWLPPRREYLFAAAFPPCTDMAVSGARWFKGKGLRRLARAIEIFASCVERLEWCGCPGFVENPVSVISSHYRRPDFTFDPCEYAGYLSRPDEEAYTKRTCLWAFGGFVLPPPRPVTQILGSKMHRLGPSEERKAIREKTPRGFSLAVFQAFQQRKAGAAC